MNLVIAGVCIVGAIVGFYKGNFGTGAYALLAAAAHLQIYRLRNK